MSSLYPEILQPKDCCLPNNSDTNYTLPKEDIFNFWITMPSHTTSPTVAALDVSSEQATVPGNLQLLDELEPATEGCAPTTPSTDGPERPGQPQDSRGLAEVVIEGQLDKSDRQPSPAVSESATIPFSPSVYTNMEKRLEVEALNSSPERVSFHDDISMTSDNDTAERSHSISPEGTEGEPRPPSTLNV